MNMRKIFGLIAVFVIAVMAAFNVNVNSKEKGLSDVSIANVEALAQGEHPLGNCLWVDEGVLCCLLDPPGGADGEQCTKTWGWSWVLQ